MVTQFYKKKWSAQEIINMLVNIKDFIFLFLSSILKGVWWLRAKVITEYWVYKI